METVRWILAGVAGLLSVTVIVGNPVSGLLAWRRGRGFSMLPFIGGVFGVIALAACPAVGWSWWMLLPLALDLTFVGSAFFLVTDALGLTSALPREPEEEQASEHDQS